jgi:hypothetical protein
VRNSLLLKLADHKESNVAFIVREHFDELPKSIRNELKRRLARHRDNT